MKTAWQPAAARAACLARRGRSARVLLVSASKDKKEKKDKSENRGDSSSGAPSPAVRAAAEVKPSHAASGNGDHPGGGTASGSHHQKFDARKRCVGGQPSGSAESSVN